MHCRRWCKIGGKVKWFGLICTHAQIHSTDTTIIGLACNWPSFTRKLQSLHAMATQDNCLQLGRVHHYWVKTVPSAWEVQFVKMENMKAYISEPPENYTIIIDESLLSQKLWLQYNSSQKLRVHVSIQRITKSMFCFSVTAPLC